MLAIAKDDVESKRLSACAQDVVDIGWLFSPTFLAEFVLPSVDVGETCLG